MGEQKKYTASDLNRYHTGAMDSDEMHALEKAALADPFLADALEGYAYTENPEKELEEMKRRLAKQRKRHSIFKWNAITGSTWWKIAAILIIIAGSGYLFLFIAAPKQNSLATKENPAANDRQETFSLKDDDSISTNGIVAFEKASIDKNKSNSIKTPMPSGKSAANGSESASVPNKTTINREANPLSETFSKEREIAPDRKDRNPDAHNAISKDGKEMGISPLSDSAATTALPPRVSETIQGYATLKDKQKPPLEEVVTTTYGAQKRNKSNASQTLEGKVSGIEIVNPPPYPKGGKEKFHQYIKDSAGVVLDSLSQRIPVNILLSFSLNKRGRPVDIKIIESSCKSCEPGAIRLLRQGPEWVGRKGAKGKVRILINSPRAGNTPVLHP